MKDELGGEIMKEFVSPRPKMYSYRVGNSEPKKCKGIKKCVVKRMISFDNYKRCLFSGESSHRSQLLFISRKHEVRTLEVNKLVLSREDDKRISIDGVASCAIGHYRVWGCELKKKSLYKMVVLTIETFKTDKITAISEDYKSSGGSNYKSVKFAYDGGEVPPIHIDGDFRLFRFRNKNSDTYSLSITCDPTNESFFRELNEVIAKESCKILKDKSIKPEDFELIRDNRSGRSVHAKIYSKKSGKVKCRISQGSYKSVIRVEELVDEVLKGSCILRIYQAYVGSCKSISLSVEEILARKIGIRESYFADESDESNEESDEEN